VESDVSSLASFHFGLFSPDFTNFPLQQNVIVSPLSIAYTLNSNLELVRPMFAIFTLVT